MEKGTWKITLADGTQLENLGLNGNNFISKSKITEEVFSGNLAEVTIESEDKEEKHTNMDLVQIAKVGKEYWFILRDIPEAELNMLRSQSQIEYIAMMTDVDLEEA